MKKKFILALCSIMIATGGIGMSSIPHEEQPVSQDLVEEAMAEEEPEEVVEEIAEEKVCVEGCTLEPGHEGDCVVEEEKEEIEVVLKTTSMERDLKVKFVDKNTGKIISGADFKMKLTSPSKKTKEYSDHDKDGIIWVTDIDGGTYTIEMLDLEGYVTAKTLSAEVKKKIEYKVVEIAEEIKKESEIVVSKEDAAYGGTSKDDSTSNSVQLQDTVESVASTKTEVEDSSARVQKKDAFGQLMYEKQAVDSFGQVVYREQKKDAFGTPMYAKILSEPASYHKDDNGDGICDRCNAELKAACMHVDKNNDNQCDICGEAVTGIHVHEDTAVVDCKCDGCGAAMHTEGDNGICSKCNTVVNTANHLTCVDNNKDNICDYTGCGKTVSTSEPEPQTPASEPEPEAQTPVSESESEPQTPVNKSESEPQTPASEPEPEPQTPASEQAPESPTALENETVPETQGEPSVQSDEKTEEETTGNLTFGVFLRPFSFLRTAQEIIVYDTTSAPVYDETSAPVYDETSAPVYDETSAPVYEENEATEYIYTGWQTIDGATYYFDKNGNKVTGHQVIDGVAYTFNSDGVRTGTIGIDVSKYQSGIDWNRVKNAGIDFVMIRCGYRGYGSGVLVEDPMFASHIKGAKAAGLRVGVYFFSQAVNEAEAVEEASMAVTLANKYGINMPIAIDSEYAAGGAGRADGLSKSARTAVTKAFCNTVASAGYTPMVYASKSWFGSHLDASQLSGYKIWVAHYADKCGYSGTYHIWQNTSKGKVDGVPGNVDMNISSI